MATNSKSSFFRRPGQSEGSSGEAKPARTPRSTDADRPKRTYTKSTDSDRPKRTYTKSDNADRPARDAKGKFAPRGAGSDRPYKSDKPYKSDRPYSSDQSRRPDRSADRPARDAKGKFAPRGAGSDRPYKSDKPFNSDKPFKSDRPYKSDKPYKSDRPYSSDQSRRPDRSADRPARGNDDRKREYTKKSFDAPSPRPEKGVPDWVKQSAPKSSAVRAEERKAIVAEALADRKAAEMEQAKADFRRAEKKELLTQSTPKAVNAEIRLNRFIAQSGICSRREADNLIEQGFIKVNGEVVTELGSKVNPSIDKVDYGGKLLSGEKLVYIIMNKPKGYVTTVEDPHNDLTVMTILGDKVKERVYPVGRLDKQTTGVLLLTNDGELTRKLTHPSFEQRKIYHAFLDKPCTMEHLEMLAKGIELEDGEIHADEVSFVDGNKKEVGIELHSGRNRIVRRMFEHLDYRVIKLDRVFFAGFTKLGLRRGYWRYLSPKEVITLRNL